MKEYDVIVIGSGGGAAIASSAFELGYTSALVEESKLGGTCLNRGCIPSKMLIHPANVANTVKEAEFHAAYARSVADTCLRYVFRKIANCAGEGSEVSLERLDKMLKSGTRELDERINLTPDTRDSVLDIAHKSVLDYASSSNVLFRVRSKEYEFRNNGTSISFL